ncbi:hypothetical protein OC835_002504 [Tilletia horrida]|nr:hypothetical protein OC835_002504 [Tilletia horrida]
MLDDSGRGGSSSINSGATACAPAPMTLPDQATLVRRRNGSVLTRGLVLKTDHPNIPLPQLRTRTSTASSRTGAPTSSSAAAAAVDALGEINLQGAHNFRAAAGGLGVYGTAQPTIGGLKTILALLGCRPLSLPTSHTGLGVSRSAGGQTSRRASAQPPPPTSAPAVSPKFAEQELSTSPPDRRTGLVKTPNASALNVLGTSPSNESRSPLSSAAAASASSPAPAPAPDSSSSTQHESEAQAQQHQQVFQYQNTCIWVCTREEPVIYVSGRPFVLREASAPTETFGLSTRASNLESIERRLRADILKEAERNGGLVLVHEEQSAGAGAGAANLAGGAPGAGGAAGLYAGSPSLGSAGGVKAGSKDGGAASSAAGSTGSASSSLVRLTPTWIAVDESNVQTPRQVWDSIRLAGWRVSYHRIPIANEQAIENNYLDAYTELLRHCDPLTTSVVANCGVGYVRTTFAMCAAMIVRRRQMMLRGAPDPLTGEVMHQHTRPTLSNMNTGVSTEDAASSGRRGRLSTVSDARRGSYRDPNRTPAQARSRSVDPHFLATTGGGGGVARSLQMASAQQAHDASVLKLLHVLSTTPAPTASASLTFGGPNMSGFGGALGGGAAGGFALAAGGWNPMAAAAAAGGGMGAVSALHPAILIPTLIAHPPLLNALRAANAGDYGVIRQLLGLLDDDASANTGGATHAEDNEIAGFASERRHDGDGVVGSKEIVDWAIDSCDQLLNLREAILQERLRYAVGDVGLGMPIPGMAGGAGMGNGPSGPGSGGSSASAGAGTAVHLYRASKHLEKYLFLLAFASYVSGSLSARFEYRFADWLRDRREIWGMIGRMRGAAASAIGANGNAMGGGGAGRMLAFFDPIADLSLISGGMGSAVGWNYGAFGKSANGTGPQSQTQAQGQAGLAGDEFAEHVVRSRAGVVLRPFMLLKNDIWISFDDDDVVNGAPALTASTATSVSGPGANLVPRAIVGPKVRGSVNFRRVAQSHVFATGQPTVEGIIGAVHAVFEMLLSSEGSGAVSKAKDSAATALRKVTWINLREEPLVYIASRPFCLRQSAKSLRNIKNYSGISWRRLNLLEDRLKADVLAELRMGEGSLLLHTERENGIVEPVWEQVREEDVMTVQEVMDMVRRRFLADADEGEGEGIKIELDYRRIPITAEKPPDLSDVAHILRTVLRARVDKNPIVLNDQLGRGRSSMTACIVLLVQRWIEKHERQAQHSQGDGTSKDAEGPKPSTSSPLSYHVINSLLRVLSQGLRVKAQVDDAIDSCAAVTNLRESIELARLAAEDTENERERRKWISHGIQSLRKYFELIIFQAYLDTVTPAELLEKEMARPAESMELLGMTIPGPQELEDDEDVIPEVENQNLSISGPKSHRNRDGSPLLSSFEQFVVSQPVFDTIARGFNKIDIETIMPLQKVDAGEGLAMADEVADVVQNRKGSILSAFTMLKSDFFVGIVKAGLKERIEGAPNLRGAAMIMHPAPPLSTAMSDTSMPFTLQPDTPSSWSMRKSESTAFSATGAEGIKMEAWGSGMPTVDGLRRALTRMGAAPGGLSEVVWTSLREEPVLYVNGRPHVLRLADQPLTNVEATGVTTEVVESMEKALKEDLVKEAAMRNGRVLLHDEVEGQRGNFEVIPIWETVGENDILTPREVYELVISEGFRVDYARLAITDEQAPIPDVFSQLENRVQLALDTGSACVFNCQMGRGRTTTGMIISSLVSTVTWHGTAILKNASFLDDDASQVGGGGGGSSLAQSDSNLRDMVMDREDQVYLAGEYRVILQLVGVLSRGKSAKKLADKAIDRMEAVQNLRKAIYDSKLRMDSADVGTKKHKHLSIVFANYLQRYGYLITFANYLLEKAQANAEANAEAESGPADGDDDGAGSMVASIASFSASAVGWGGGSKTWGSVGGPTAHFPTFAEWLRSRREILSILGRTE